MTAKQVGDKIVDPGFLSRSDDPGVMPPTSRAELDIAVAELQANKESWIELDLAERIHILDQILVDLHAVADEWVSASVQAKDTQGNDFAEGEEWAMLVPADFIYKLFVEGSVVILKMNPVNAYLGPILARGFRKLVERNFLRIVYGGAEVGNYLCHHPVVDELHITGSDKTYEAIVFGLVEQAAKRKEQRNPF